MRENSIFIAVIAPVGDTPLVVVKKRPISGCVLDGVACKVSAR